MNEFLGCVSQQEWCGFSAVPSGLTPDDSQPSMWDRVGHKSSRSPSYLAGCLASGLSFKA
jgi:hypothetical protein